MFIQYWDDLLGETSKHGVKLFMWRTAGLSKARNRSFYINLVQLCDSVYASGPDGS